MGSDELAQARARLVEAIGVKAFDFLVLRIEGNPLCHAAAVTRVCAPSGAAKFERKLLAKLPGPWADAVRAMMARNNERAGRIRMATWDITVEDRGESVFN